MFAPVVVAAFALDGLLLVVGGTDPASSPDVGEVIGFLNYGVLGVVVALLLTRRLRVAGEVVECESRVGRAEARAIAAEERERALYESIRTEIVPAMTRITDRLVDAGKT